MSKSIEVFPDLTSLIDRALSLMLARIKTALADHGYCAIALAGGSTPKPLYEAIAHQDLPWQQIHIFWGDERYVAPDHPDSNQRMARLAWLDRIPIPAANIHPMPTDSHDPGKDAQIHEQELQAFFQLSPDSSPALILFSLAWGMMPTLPPYFPRPQP